MIAIEYRKSIPRYLALRAVGPRWRGAYTSALSPLSMRELPAPKLPTPAWVRVRPILTGICGSDLATVCAKGSPYFSPLTSTPFVLGHEIVGTITEVGNDAAGVAVGQRVVIQPALGCAVRGIEPACAACAAGQIALCCNVTRGVISAGIQTGFCRDTGGGWSESLVAHPTQVHAVPDAIDDEAALLAEPLACALHAALRARRTGWPTSSEVGEANQTGFASPTAKAMGHPMPEATPPTVLVMGCGSIGLLTIAAIRAVATYDAALAAPRIIAVAKHAHQREHAEALGADLVLPYARDVKQRYTALADALGAELHQPEIGKPTVIGGADVTFDCVASSASIDDCFRFTRAGGRMILVGMPAIPTGIDWTALWYKELTIHAAYAYGIEQLAGQERSTFALALDVLQTRGHELRELVGKPFALTDYRNALRAALATGASRSVKTVFRI